MMRGRAACVLAGLLLAALCAGCSARAELGRFGVCAEHTEDLGQQLDALGDVWYYDYTYVTPTAPGHGRLFMIRHRPFDERLAEIMRENRGAWWAVGNEPNDPNQDYRTPAEYAQLYHEFHSWAKGIDRRARIIPAGFADADWPWAEAFRESYREQYGRYPPVDGWNLHNYVLDGDPYDLDEFKRRVIAFRHWILEIGDEDLPLFLTEFGVLYGAGCCDRPVDPPELTVAFMRGSVAWLAETDYVQHWAWFILNNAREFNGGLHDGDGGVTIYGETYRELIEGHLR
jgi:hypothetical protein